MALQLQDTWFGKGLVFQRLIIRKSLGGGIEGLLMDAQPSYIKTKTIDLSHYETLDEAIEAITHADWQYYTELTAYGEEG